MQKRLRQYLKWIFFCESVAGVLVVAALVVLCTIWDQSPDLLKGFLVFFIIISVIAMVLSLILVFRWIYYYILSSFGEVESERNQSDTLNREVISSIAHDLRTPLTAIKGYAQGILDGVAGSTDRMNKYVLTIRNKADDMAGLVDELSFFTHMYQSNFKYHWEETGVRDYFSECISELSLDLETRNINLAYRFDVDPDLKIRIDKEKMKRVIINIIGNASKYIQKENGIVYIEMEEGERNLLVHITDNGAGIAKEDLTRIFERFYRTDSSRNSKTGGSGLGLAIAKKIIEDHKGEIWAESELGKGTRISFSLPKEAGL